MLGRDPLGEHQGERSGTGDGHSLFDVVDALLEIGRIDRNRERARIRNIPRDRNQYREWVAQWGGCRLWLYRAEVETRREGLEGKHA